MSAARRVAAAMIAGFLLLFVAACGGDDDDATDGPASSAAATAGTTSPGSSGLSGTLTVFAAASLTAGFEALADSFEAANPRVHVKFNFAASSELAAQINEGAPADVFASADEANVQKVVDAGNTAGDPVVFAHNELTIAVEKGNPKDITGLADLAEPDLIVVLCASEVPCGRYADQALANANVTVTPKSRGESVKATLAVVEAGEADAAIVYATDVKASGKVDGVDIPDDQNVSATLPIVALKDAGNAPLASAWIAYVTSADAQHVLVDDYGFLGK
jgi:molybdate transport system substrate-binding protein